MLTLVTSPATAGIAFTQQAILRFFHDSRISVKFGPLRRAKFHTNQWIFGVSGPKNTKNCQNFQLFRPTGANPLPNSNEIRRVYAGNQCTKATNIRCNLVNKLGIYRQKTAMGHFQKKFRSPLAPKLLIGLKKIKEGAKMVRTSSIFMQSLVEIHCCTAAWETKVGCFFFLFVCLFVTIWILNRGLVIQTAILSPLVGQFWCGFQHSLEEEMLFQTFKGDMHYAARWRRICLRIRSKVELFLKIWRAQFVHTTSTI